MPAARLRAPRRKQAVGVINGDVDTVVADASRAALLAVAGDAVADLAKAGELFDVDMDQVSRMLPLVALHWRFGFEISQPLETKEVEHPGHGGGCRAHGGFPRHGDRDGERLP